MIFKTRAVGNRRTVQDKKAWLLSPQRHSAARFRPVEASPWAEWVEVTEAELKAPQKPLVGQPRRMLRRIAEQLWRKLASVG
jgi:hypothetical protein